MVDEQDLRASVRKERRTERALQLYREGLCNRAIAEALSISESWVCKALKSAGVPRRGYRKSAA